jgi:propanol-preferring alcohol dehydrogenase
LGGYFYNEIGEKKIIKMKSMRLFKPGKVNRESLVYDESPKPEPGPRSVRLKVQYCGVCHTDLHTVEGDIHPPKLPITPGHQVVGRIDAIGPDVKKTLKIGDRVGVSWVYTTCGECYYCRSNYENLCDKAMYTGFHVDGGYAEYMIADVDYLLPLPESISDENAAPLLCAGIIGYRSLRKADVKPGERVGLFGFGASAHLTIQVATYWGCEVYVFTRSSKHRRHADELGATWVGGAEDKPPRLLDRAVIFAPAGNIVPLALEKTRPGGTVAINAIHMSNIPEMPYRLLYGERTLRSVANLTYQDGNEFLAIAAEIPIQPTTSRYSLESANQALIDLKNSRINGEAVLQIA